MRLAWKPLREHLNQFAFSSEYGNCPILDYMEVDEELLEKRAFPIIEFMNENGVIDSYGDNVALYQLEGSSYVLINYAGDDNTGEFEVTILIPKKEKDAQGGGGG